MVTLVVEDGSGKADANTLISLAAATSYHEGNLYASAWTAAASTTRETALVMATRIIDQGVRWRGSKEDEDNALEWPRLGVVDHNGFTLDSNVVPERVKTGVAEFARWLIESDRTAEAETKGLSQIEAGPLKAVIDRDDRTAVIPDIVVNMIRPYIHEVFGQGVVARLERG
jgi:hypothetical protein